MKVAIAGYGTEGKANYQYWLSLGHDVTIVDERNLPADELPYGAKTLLGEDVFGKLEDFDLVVRTAGLSPAKIKSSNIWSATNEFFAKCPVDIIGVTGTKGKGTTSSLIASIFEAAGRKAHLVGNIGTAALEVLPEIQLDDVVVFELSSFQLWDIQRSPHVAVILPIEADHLNVHTDMEDYVAAKANIRRHQLGEDICVYHPTNKFAAEIAHVTELGTTMRYAIPDDGAVYESQDYFCQNEQNICSIEALQLLGRHNVENACAAISVAKTYGIENDAIERGLQSFKGLPHRLEYVRTIDGVDYFNDSFSAAPGATIAAISSFEKPEILILGGTDKGADFSDLIHELEARSNIKKILLVGEMRHKLYELLDAVGLSKVVQLLEVKTMKEIIDVARQEASDGDVVILSPACASFDMFRNFKDRGDQFRSIVQSL